MKKIIRVVATIIAVVVMTFTITACADTSSLQSDIDSLKQQLDSQKEQINSLEGQIDSLEEQVNEKANVFWTAKETYSETETMTVYYGKNAVFSIRDVEIYWGGVACWCNCLCSCKFDKFSSRYFGCVDTANSISGV